MRWEVIVKLAEKILTLQPKKSKFFEDHILCDKTEIRYSDLGFGIDRLEPDDLEVLTKALAKKLHVYNFVYYYEFDSLAKHGLFRLSE